MYQWVASPSSELQWRSINAQTLVNTGLSQVWCSQPAKIMSASGEADEVPPPTTAAKTATEGSPQSSKNSTVSEENSTVADENNTENPPIDETRTESSVVEQTEAENSENDQSDTETSALESALATSVPTETSGDNAGRNCPT